MCVFALACVYDVMVCTCLLLFIYVVCVGGYVCECVWYLYTCVCLSTLYLFTKIRVLVC